MACLASSDMPWGRTPLGVVGLGTLRSGPAAWGSVPNLPSASTYTSWAVPVVDCRVPDVGDIGPVIHLAKNTVDTTHGADSDNARAGGDSTPGKCTHAHVVSAFGDTISSLTAQARIVCAGGVIEERSIANSRVESAGGVVLERMSAGGRAAVTGGVVLERKITGGRVGAAGGVAKERAQLRWPCSSRLRCFLTARMRRQPCCCCRYR